jgi:hypothetical protein
MPEDKRVEKYIRRLHDLKNERQSWEGLFKRISDYVLPRKGRFDRDSKPNDGREKGDKILDDVATRALRVLAAGLQGGLTSPARPWFRLGTQDPDLSKQKGIKMWLHEVERRMYQALAKSNFYSRVHGLYTEQAGFGTGCMIEEADLKTRVRFDLFTAGEYWLATDAHGMVDTLYYERQMTARQLVQQYGLEALPKQIQSSLQDNTNRDQYWKVLHCIQPRAEFDPEKGARGVRKHMPFESVVICEQKIVFEGGYFEFPVLAPRWDVTGAEVYGRSPAMDVLKSVIILQEINKTELMGLHKMLNPPMKVPADYAHRLSLLPGAENPVALSNPDAVGPLYQISPDIKAAEYKLERVENRIREGLFNDLFLMILERPGMTATEVVERHEEKLLMLGPVIERQQTELLDPLMERTYAILERHGLIPPPPEEIEGEELKVEYISLLSQAQKLVGTQSIHGLAAFVGNLAQMKPQVLDKIDEDAAVDEYADMVGAPPSVIRSADQVAQIRMARAEQEAQVRQQEQVLAAQQAAGQAAQTAKTLSETTTNNPDNALGALQEMMTGG